MGRDRPRSGQGGAVTIIPDLGVLARNSPPGEPPPVPLYDQADVQRTMKLVHTVPYLRPQEIADGAP